MRNKPRIGEYPDGRWEDGEGGGLLRAVPSRGQANAIHVCMERTPL